MLSGNGRHRRPRQAPALIVAAGVTGSAIAIPLLGATGASAADGTTWDRVAECESGGEWSADSGNGYYGGLQLTQENWEKYGGLAYASSADQASRSQQIAIGEKVLDGQGLTAWPTCGPLSGLSKSSGGLLVDTGVASDSATPSASSTPSASDTSSTPSTKSSSSASSGSASSGSSSAATEDTTKADTSSGSSGASAEASVTPGSDNSGKSGQNGDSSSTSGSHPGGSAADGTTDDTSGARASRGSDASRLVADGSYVVRLGDSLSTIADALDLKGGWSELYTVNERTVGADPDLILPGQSLAVGAESGEK
jgi:hypothetical protein